MRSLKRGLVAGAVCLAASLPWGVSAVHAGGPSITPCKVTTTTGCFTLSNVVYVPDSVDTHGSLLLNGSGKFNLACTTGWCLYDPLFPVSGKGAYILKDDNGNVTEAGIWQITGQLDSNFADMNNLATPCHNAYWPRVEFKMTMTDQKTGNVRLAQLMVVSFAPLSPNTGQSAVISDPYSSTFQYYDVNGSVLSVNC